MAEKDQIDEKEVQSPEKKKKSPLVFVLVILVVFVFLGGGTFFALKNNIIAFPGGGDTNTPGHIKDEPGIIIPLDTFIVNLADTDVQRYLKVVIKLETWDPLVSEEASKRMAQLRDAIITLLTTQTYQDVSTFKGKTYLRTEITNRINSYLRTGKIEKVYLTEFVIQ